MSPQEQYLAQNSLAILRDKNVPLAKMGPAWKTENILRQAVFYTDCYLLSVTTVFSLFQLEVCSPDVISTQVDVFPSQRGQMRNQLFI